MSGINDYFPVAVFNQFLGEQVDFYPEQGFEAIPIDAVLEYDVTEERVRGKTCKLYSGTLRADRADMPGLCPTSYWVYNGIRFRIAQFSQIEDKGDGPLEINVRGDQPMAIQPESYRSDL